MKSSVLIIPALIILTLSCTSTVAEEERASLKSSFTDDFYIGAALDTNQIQKNNPEEYALIQQEFSSITGENVMKWMYIHPERDKFDFRLSDAFVELAEENEMFVVGHTLVWHSQLADWLNEISDSSEMANTLKEHITSVVTHYKGRVHGYDVVNEAINDDGTIRESIFYNAIGGDYISKSFEWAAAADPEAELYYNDYNLWIPEKRDAVVEMVKGLQGKGVKIDGIGMQGHYGLEGPDLDSIEASIEAFEALGVKVMFTELDINVLPNPWDLQGADVDQNFEGDATMNAYVDGLPDSVNMVQAKRYEAMFKLFLKHSDVISRVTFWGVHDGQSWKNNWPINGRTDYALIFDREFQPKKSYEAIMRLKNRE